MLLQRATSCSSEFSVTSHSVVVRRRDGGGEEGGGEEVARALALSSTTDLLRGVVRDLPRDSALLVEVEACNVLLCRTSRALDLCEWRLQSYERGQRKRGLRRLWYHRKAS